MFNRYNLNHFQLELLRSWSTSTIKFTSPQNQITMVLFLSTQVFPPKPNPSALKPKMKEQAGTKKKEGGNPKNLSNPRFFSLPLGDNFLGTSTTGKPLPKAGKPAKINKMTSHNPTNHHDGYTDIRPFSKVMWRYLSEEEIMEYIWGHRTPEPGPASPLA